MSKNVIGDILDTVARLLTKENVDTVQTYILGTKKNGSPRAVYDVVKDYTVKGDRKKGKRKHKKLDSFALYLGPGKSKKKKRNKNKKHWRYDD